MSGSYILAKILSRFSKNKHEFMSAYFRKNGLCVGNGCNICSNIKTTEGYLIEVGDDTTISTEVLFINHDASVGKLFGKKNGSDICGRIVVGNNCFIGARSIILYGVTLSDNIIVAAGSVVTKSFLTPNVIIGGNPAKEISTWEVFSSKIRDKVYNLHGKKGEKAKRIITSSSEKLIVR